VKGHVQAPFQERDPGREEGVRRCDYRKCAQKKRPQKQREGAVLNKDMPLPEEGKRKWVH
jgi:hypothetical protein